MQKHVNLVDLVKSFPTNIFLQNLASIQKRTSPIKFAHLAEKSEKGSISNLSTKVEDQGLDKINTYVWLSSKDGDLRSKADTEAIFSKYEPTKVIHLAARVGGLFANMADNLGFFEDNMNMNNNVISCCHERKITDVIFCLSTCAADISLFKECP